MFNESCLMAVARINFFLYIPPHNSNYFCPDLFDELENDIEKFSTLGSVLILGDFNSRTGKYSDIVCQEGNTLITNDQSQSLL